MGSPHDVSGAAHVDDRTALRLEGVAPSVEARLKGLRDLLAVAGATMEELGTLESRTFWRDVRDVAPLSRARDAVVWKISCPPTEGPGIVARIKAQRPSAEAFYDWSGGLVWLALPPSARRRPCDRARRSWFDGRSCHLDSRRRERPVERAGLPAAADGARRAGIAREGKLRSEGPLQSGPHGLSDADQLHPGPARRSGDRAQRAHPAQVRALRLLHRDLPDLRAAGRRARQPARAHLLHQGDAGGRSRADGVGGQARRPLPVVPELHDDLSVGRALHAPGRSRPASHRGALSGVRCRIGCCAGCWPG